MLFLKNFTLVSNEHDVFDKRNVYNSHYPLGIFPQLGLGSLEFDDVTVFCGDNGVGKSTLLKIIAAKVGAKSRAYEKQSPLFQRYVDRCYHELTNTEQLRDIKLLTSDDVFDDMLNIRAINSGINRRKEELTNEYLDRRYTPADLQFSVGDEDSYRRLEDVVDSRRMTQSRYIRTRLINNNIKQNSNGESSLEFWAREIEEYGLYLLDEPENSLSPKNQAKLKAFIEESVRFFKCQFIISSHSPFLLGINGARIYDLDNEGRITRWQDLESIQTYYRFFEENRERFK